MIDDFLASPLTARVATDGPTVRPKGGERYAVRAAADGALTVGPE